MSKKSKKSPTLEEGDLGSKSKHENETMEKENDINILGNERDVEKCGTAEPEDRNDPEDTTTTITGISTEILMRIFSMLNNKDLSNVVSVCRRWREVGDCVWNWNDGIRNRIRGSCDIEMLTINRVQHIGKLVIMSCSDEDLNKLFETLESLSKLTNLWMHDGIDLTTLDTSLVVNTVLTIKTVHFRMCKLTAEQLNTLFVAINETTKLQTLTLDGVDLSGVDKDILAAGVNQLQRVQLLYRCKLTAEQLNNMFGTIDETTKLQTLTLNEVNLAGVDKDILAAGVNQLQRVELHWPRLDTRQVTALLTQAARKTHLGYLYLGNPHCYRGMTVDEEIVRLARLNIGNLKW